MTDSEIIISALEENLPLECDIAGTSNVEDIADSAISKNLQFKNVEETSRIDLDTTITVLSSAAGLAAQLIQLYRDWKETEKANPEAKDLKDKVDDSIISGLDEKVVEKICNTIIDKLKSDKEIENDKK